MTNFDGTRARKSCGFRARRISRGGRGSTDIVDYMGERGRVVKKGGRGRTTEHAVAEYRKAH